MKKGTMFFWEIVVCIKLLSSGFLEINKWVGDEKLIVLDVLSNVFDVFNEKESIAKKWIRPAACLSFFL